MTWVKVKGLKIVVSRGHVYAYHRATGEPLEAKPVRRGGAWFCTPELLAEIASLESTSSSPRAGSVAAMIDSYKGSDAFTELSDVSKSDYSKVMRWILDRAGEASPLGLTAVRAREIRDLAVRKKGWRFGKYVLQVMRLVWQHGADYGMVQDNPWRAISYPKRPRKLTEREANRPWAKEEFWTVVRRAPVGLARAYTLALLSFRPSHVRTILWTAVKSGAVEGRSKKTRFDALQDIPPSLAWVFEGNRPAVTVATNANGKPFKSDNALAKASGDFLRRLIREGVVAPGLTMKGLNHTLGTALAEQGVDPRSAMDAQQKKTLTTTLHYSRRADTRRNARQALSELEKWLSLENSLSDSGKPEQNGT